MMRILKSSIVVADMALAGRLFCGNCLRKIATEKECGQNFRISIMLLGSLVTLHL